MKTKNITVNNIDQLLPQTQCGLCDYESCRPYAKAIAENGERIDRCPPGGTETFIALANLLNQNPEPFLIEMQKKSKPASIAVIREDECIGCTKCIQACPTDAIIGTGKFMHAVISDACTGCELCIEPCPVDCIDMIIIEEHSCEQKKEKASQWRARYEKHQTRLSRDKKEHQEKQEATRQARLRKQSVAERKAAIQAAIQRSREKKQHKGST